VSCENCPYKGKVTVPPRGLITSNLWIIGEAPGENEEKQREPFVGGSGKILYRLLRDAGIDPQSVYYTNVLKCRPPNNDITTIDAQNAILCCTAQLHTELAVGHPRVIVPVGNTALHALGITQSITKVRGTPLATQWGKVIPTFHPAYLMRQQQEFVTASYDWKKIAKHMESTGFPQFKEDYNLFPKLDDVVLFWEKVQRSIREHGSVELAIDLETPFEGDHYEKTILVCGIATSESEAIVIPFHKADGRDYWGTQGEEEQVIEILSALFNHPKVTKILHNALFDLAVLRSLGFPVRGPIYDTMLAHWLVYEPAHHSLAYCASIYTDLPPWKIETQWNDDLSLRRRNARDATILFPIKKALDEDIKDNGCEWMLTTVMENIPPTVEMERAGIPINPQKQKETAIQLQATIDSELRALQALVARPDFNPNSPQQVGAVLADRFGRHFKATGKDILEDLAKDYEDPFPAAVLHYRSLVKMKGTYVENVRVWPDNRVRSHFKIGTVTARYKSEDPNLQNLPSSRKDADGFVRRMYEAPPGQIIVEGDLSQTELRIFAQLIGDEKWLSAFAEGRDIHAENCTALTGEYRKEWRTFAKNFIFGLIYGSEGSEIEKVMPLSLREQGVTVRSMIARLHEEHPKVKQYFEEVERSVRAHHVVRNPFGLLRWFPGEPTKANVREAINFPIQSACSCIMHAKMPQLSEAVGERGQLFLQIHDAFYVLTDEDNRDSMVKTMRGVMEAPIEAPNGVVFQLPASFEVGKNMFELEAYNG